MKLSISKMAVVATASLLASLSFSGAAIAERGAPPGHDPVQMVEKMTQRLNLTEQQQSQITALLESEKENVRSEREQLKGLREQLTSHDGEFDSDSARKTADKIGVISGNLAYARAYTQSELNKILTEDQQAQLSSFMNERGGHRGERRKR